MRNPRTLRHQRHRFSDVVANVHASDPMFQRATIICVIPSSRNCFWPLLESQPLVLSHISVQRVILVLFRFPDFRIINSCPLQQLLALTNQSHIEPVCPSTYYLVNVMNQPTRDQ